jgi:hypothetical protein
MTTTFQNINATETRHEAQDCVVTTYECGIAFYAKAISGKRTKNDWHYRFKTDEKRQEYINKYLSDRAASIAYKVKCKNEKSAEKSKLNAVEQFPIGSIVYSSWGYDQTNLDYYQVVGHFGRIGCTLVSIGQTRNGEGYRDAAMCMPDTTKKGNEILKARQTHKSRLSLAGSRYGLSLWDGRPNYSSWYA